MLVMLGFAGLLAERNNTTYLFSAGFGVYCIVLGAAVSVIELASLFTKVCFSRLEKCAFAEDLRFVQL